jgi:hypothetical protein
VWPGLANFMAQKENANSRRDNIISATESTPKYHGNKEFVIWWEHWMSKLPKARVGTVQSSARSDAVAETTKDADLDHSLDERDAA